VSENLRHRHKHADVVVDWAGPPQCNC
jgi:hypothetical protein